MANIPNANQYRSRNPNGTSNQGNRPRDPRHQDVEDTSPDWATGLGRGAVIGLVLLWTTNPFLAALGTVVSAAAIAHLSKQD